MSSAPYLEDWCSELPGPGRSRTVRVWNPPGSRAVIVGIHGGMSHSGDLATVGEYFRGRDVVTLSADLSGHGKHKRIRTHRFDDFLDDVDAMLGFAKQLRPGVPVFLMGHSMGGLIAAHFMMSGRAQTSQIKGVILSSPYFANAIPVPRLLIPLSGVLAAVYPGGKVPMDSVTHLLTRDPAITQRHQEDERLQRRATEASFGFAHALLDAQIRLQKNFSWGACPVFAAIAGKDHLADSQTAINLLQKIEPSLLNLRHFPENFHENFNELGRDSLFQEIDDWMNAQLRSA